MDGARDRRNRPSAPMLALFALTTPLAVAAGLTAAAQAPPAPTYPTRSPSTTTPPASAPCELHVWPAATTHTTFQGWVRAGAVDGARRGLKGYPDLHANALDSASQARLLATIDWRGAFGDPALVVIVHPAPTGAADDRARAVRLVAEGSSPCYRELIIAGSLVESEVFSKQSVRVLGLRKRFDGPDSAPVNFSSMSEADIVISDADRAAPDAGERMDAAVRAAFVAAVSRFAVMQSFH